MADERILIPELNKKPGIYYVFSEDGIELPVIDVTHPAFRVPINPEEVAAITESSLSGLKRSAGLPAATLQAMAQYSLLMRKTIESAGHPMSSMTTYLLKLGPENLGDGYANNLDRQLAAAITPLAMRIRLQTMVELLSKALLQELMKNTCTPLVLINLAAGTAMDSLNTLLKLQKLDPAVLSDRDIRILALDNEPSGFPFASRVLLALSREEGPLTNFSVQLISINFNWTHPFDWQSLSAKYLTEKSILGITSEGGLFEYAQDQDIIENLRCIYEIPGNFPIVGSFVRDEAASRTIKEIGSLPLRLFSMDRFASLVRQAGWQVGSAVEGNPIYSIVELRKQNWY